MQGASLILTVAETLPVDVALRVYRAAEGADLYLTVRPRAAGGAEAQAEALMRTVAAVLGEHGAAILEERIFGTAAGLCAAATARARWLAAFDDGVAPTSLEVPATARGELAGVVLHAVAGGERPQALTVDGRICGRRWRQGRGWLVTGSGLQAGGEDASAQARGMLAQAEALLERAGGGWGDVVRTWMWLGGILEWYGEFNRVRNALFGRHGLLQGGGASPLPASTGVGIGPHGGGCCAMDLVADVGHGRPRFLLSAGRQGAASDYGSAFSRAAIVPSPFGERVYVSGTAAIDAAGRTAHPGDAAAQIVETLACVEAVLCEAGCGWSDVAQAMVYCKTAEVERVFNAGWAEWAVPHLSVIADICRDDLLFEVECLALKGAREP